MFMRLIHLGQILGATYNSEYISSINIFEDSPGYSGVATYNGQSYGYAGTASGTVDMCTWYQNTFESGFFSWLSSGSGSTPQTFKPYICQYINGIKVTSDAMSDYVGGSIEYIISDSQPDQSTLGTVVNDIITYKNYGVSVVGTTIENPQNGTIWLRITDRYGTQYDASNYVDNNGRYKVNIVQPTVKNSDTFLSSLAKFVINPITQNINMTSQKIFNNAEASTDYITIIRMLLLLYIVFYGFAFLMGMDGITQGDFFVRIVKFGVVLTLTSGGAITFFNTYLFSFFVNGQTQLINLVTGSSAATIETGQLNTQTLFSFADYAVNIVFSSHFLSILGSFVLWFPIGWICLIILIYAVVVYIFAILEITIAYLMAYTGMGLLIALAPIFIPLILFKQTRQIFDGWIKAFATYMMEPVMMFATITLIAAFVNDTLFNIISLQLTSTAVVPVFIDFGALGTIDLFTIYWPNPSNTSGGDVVIFVLTQIVIFYIFIDLLKKAGAIANTITEKIFESGGSHEAAAGMLGGIKTGVNAAVGAPILAAGAAASAFGKLRAKRTGGSGADSKNNNTKSENNRTNSANSQSQSQSDTK
jgi:type IV secretory pathway VirB6-like protein